MVILEIKKEGEIFFFKKDQEKKLITLEAVMKANEVNIHTKQKLNLTAYVNSGWASPGYCQ